MLKKQIKTFVREHRDEIVKELTELLKIPSVSTDRQSCQKMLEAVKALYEKNGFECKLYDEYLLAHYGEGQEEIGLFAHGDVVEGAEGWLLSKGPFEPSIYDGALVGRGASDNKSAIVCSLYTLIALRELNIPINKRIVCFTGSNEENGMSDIIKYVKANTPPDFSLVIDAAFPLFYGDKGKAWVRVKAKNSLRQITSFSGGRTINIILGKAEARAKYSSELFNSIKETDRVKVKKEGDELVIIAEGISAHGANPEGSINAAWLIADALKDSCLDCEDRKIISAACRVLGSYYGESVGIENDDSVFGKLTMTNGIVGIEDGKLFFTLDLRFGKAAKMEQMLCKLQRELDLLGFDCQVLCKDDAYSVSTDNKDLKVCLEAYKSYTGEENAPIYINAGSTYARHIGNACEIGTSYRGKWLDLPKGHGNAHQKDEYIDIDGMMNALEIIIYMVGEVGK